MFSTLREVWTNLRPYLSVVPTYPGSQWVFALASERSIEPERFDRKQAEDIAKRCDYYNADLQTAAFALPNNIKRRLS